MKRHAECHPDRQHSGRGLCEPCYARAARAGTLTDYPRRTRTRAEFLADYEALRGCPPEVIAARLGVTVGAVRQAVYRARRAGERVW